VRLKPGPAGDDAVAAAVARRARPRDWLRGIEPPIRANAATKLSTELVGRLATFALMVVAARRLGAADFGLYSYALAVGYVLAQISDLGLQTLITREVAVLDRAARPLVRTALGVKVGLSLLPFVLAAAVTVDRSPDVRAAFLCFAAAMVLQTFTEFSAYVFRGQQKLRREAALLTGTRLAVAGAGAAALGLGASLLGLAVTTLVATAAGAAAGLVALRTRGWLAERPRRFRETAAPLLRAALPLGAATFLSIAFTRIALFLLDERGGATAVAQFSAAQRIVEPTQVLPFALLAAVFPAFSLALHTDPARARRLGVATTLWLFLFGGVVAFTVWITAPWVPRLYGNGFGGSVDVVHVLGLSIVPAYVNYALTHMLVARNQQALATVFMAAVLVLHGALAWLLIPAHGAVGPAISYVVAEVVLTVCCLGTLAFTRRRR
jgi:O-antigen/teichoic acid export membrane protein